MCELPYDQAKLDILYATDVKTDNSFIVSGLLSYESIEKILSLII